jgi:hypothetical protein
MDLGSLRLAGTAHPVRTANKVSIGQWLDFAKRTIPYFPYPHDSHCGNPSRPRLSGASVVGERTILVNRRRRMRVFSVLIVSAMIGRTDRNYPTRAIGTFG